MTYFSMSLRTLNRFFDDFFWTKIIPPPVDEYNTEYEPSYLKVNLPYLGERSFATSTSNLNFQNLSYLELARGYLFTRRFLSNDPV